MRTDGVAELSILSITPIRSKLSIRSVWCLSTCLPCGIPVHASVMMRSCNAVSGFLLTGAESRGRVAVTNKERAGQVNPGHGRSRSLQSRTPFCVLSCSDVSVFTGRLGKTFFLGQTFFLRRTLFCFTTRLLFLTGLKLPSRHSPHVLQLNVVLGEEKKAARVLIDPFFATPERTPDRRTERTPGPYFSLTRHSYNDGRQELHSYQDFPGCTMVQATNGRGD